MVKLSFRLSKRFCLRAVIFTEGVAQRLSINIHIKTLAMSSKQNYSNFTVKITMSSRNSKKMNHNVAKSKIKLILRDLKRI